jgi:hypothetical protein
MVWVQFRLVLSPGLLWEIWLQYLCNGVCDLLVGRMLLAVEGCQQLVLQAGAVGVPIVLLLVAFALPSLLVMCWWLLPLLKHLAKCLCQALVWVGVPAGGI